MENDELKRLLGPEILNQLESFGETAKNVTDASESMAAAIDNVIGAATLARAYHVALRLAGYTDEQAFAMSREYVGILWGKFHGQRS